jgi:hypothetical protein
MLLLNSYRNRMEKLNYLKGLLLGRYKIYHIMEKSVLLFIEDLNTKGNYFQAEEGKFTPKEGDERRYTAEEVQKLKKQPDKTVIEVSFTKL